MTLAGSSGGHGAGREPREPFEGEARPSSEDGGIPVGANRVVCRWRLGGEESLKGSRVLIETAAAFVDPRAVFAAFPVTGAGADFFEACSTPLAGRLPLTQAARVAPVFPQVVPFDGPWEAQESLRSP